MDPLTIFGLCAVGSMLLTYAMDAKSHWFTLAFAGSCALGSSYGFMQGAWPFGLIEGIWALVALDRWRKRRGLASRTTRVCPEHPQDEDPT